MKTKHFIHGGFSNLPCVAANFVARDSVLYIPISAYATRMKEDTTDAWAILKQPAGAFEIAFFWMLEVMLEIYTPLSIFTCEE